MSDNGSLFLHLLAEEEKGYLGVALAYLGITYSEDEYTSRAKELRAYLSSKFPPEEWNAIIDRVLATRLNNDEREATKYFFGLQTRSAHSLEDTAICMNKTQGLSRPYYDLEDIESLLTLALRILGRDAEFSSIALDAWMRARLIEAHSCPNGNKSDIASPDSKDCNSAKDNGTQSTSQKKGSKKNSSGKGGMPR